MWSRARSGLLFTMAASPFLVGVALLATGGAAYLWYRAKQLQSQSTTQNVCAGACGTNATCLAACNAAGGIVSVVGDAIVDAATYVANSDPLDQMNNERARRQAVNDQLNGAAAIENPMTSISVWHPLQSTVLRYQNACEPFFDAPGWPKCAAGTQDMYSTAVNVGAGHPYDLTEADLVTSYASETPPTGAQRTAGVPIVKGNFLTGLAGDPTTLGPFGGAGADLLDPLGELAAEFAVTQQSSELAGAGVNLDQDLDEATAQLAGAKFDFVQTPEESQTGPSTWLARATRITCPAGQVPKTFVLAAEGIANPDATETCVDPNSPTNACQNGAAPPGFTWSTSGGGHWERVQAGQVVNNGPCAPQATGGVEATAVKLGLDAARTSEPL